MGSLVVFVLCQVRMVTANSSLSLRIAIFIGAVFHALTCAGAFFGFNSLARLLSLNGAFASFCESPLSTCEAQQVQLYNLYSYGTLCALIAPLFSGLASDRFGPKFVICTVTAIFITGILLLYFSHAFQKDDYLFPAILLIGTAASANLIPLFSTANLFPDNKSLAISILSGSFDAGSCVFLFMNILYERGFTLKSLLISYLAGPVFICTLMAIFLWPNKAFESKQELNINPPVSVNESKKEGEITVDVEEEDDDNKNEEEDEDNRDDEVPHTPLVAIQPTVRRAASMLSIQSPKEQKKEEPTPVSVVSIPEQLNFLKGIDTTKLSSLSLLEQIQSPEYLLYALYFSTCMIRFNTFIANLVPVLDSKGQSNQEYAKIFSTILPLGSLVVFIAGFIIDKKGPVNAFYILSTLALLVSIIELIPILEIQPIAFISFAAFRAFQFAAMSSYLALVFGFKNLGALIGLVTLCGGIVGFSQIGFTSWAVNNSNNFLIPNCVILMLMISTFAWPIYLTRRGTST